MKTSAEIRQQFLDFFAEHDHTVVASASLVPGNDPTLLFTNAGMVPFKDVFLGAEQRSYQRATSSQRCVRAGGKHNDLDQVGYTARHHTFFEMLGNFSFGDYFKRDAIQLAWRFLTQVLELPPERLWVTVFEEDDESAAIWLDDVGVDPERLSRIGAKDNFWQMGDTGPCGPCTEIFYDHGEDIAGGPPGTPEEDGDRYTEIWNLVFMQFDRSADGTLKPLPKPCVDTGMGLERLAAVLQGVHSNFDIDLFQDLMTAAATALSIENQGQASLKVIADHIRASAFLIVDGVLPSNEGRGYVLRRIIRRALRHGYMLGARAPFFHQLVTALVDQMGSAYPELTKKQAFVAEQLKAEEVRFGRTLGTGMKLLEETIAALTSKTIPGDVAFKLYDTYGFPLDLTQDIGREKGLDVDIAGFEDGMAAQRERARRASKFDAGQTIDADMVQDLPPTEFLGYDQVLVADATVLSIWVDDQTVDSVGGETDALIVLDRTPFYAESGGQVGDTGTLSHDAARFDVADTVKLAGVYHAHRGRVVSGRLNVGDQVKASIDCVRRQRTVRNHSATHLLHAALRQLLGEHVEQKGSLVAPDRLRFDFSHGQAVTADELASIERQVNGWVRDNLVGDAQEMGFDDAIAAGAMALFGEKYGEHVRVLTFGEPSVELCGGTHVDRTGDIGLFKIVSESAIASGVRRIEAVTGRAAVDQMQTMEHELRSAAAHLGAAPDKVNERLQQLLANQRALEKELKAVKSEMAAAAGADLASQASDIGGIPVIAARLDGVERDGLRETAERLRDQTGGVVVLGGVNDGKVMLIAAVHSDHAKVLPAGNVVNHVAAQVGGRGGGRPELAQAGGSNPDQLDAALATVIDFIANPS